MSYFSLLGTSIGKCSTSRGTFKCPDCDYVASRKDNYHRHQIIHSGERPHQCQYCFKSFNRKDNLGAHIRNCHYSD